MLAFWARCNLISITTSRKFETTVNHTVSACQFQPTLHGRTWIEMNGYGNDDRSSGVDPGRASYDNQCPQQRPFATVQVGLPLRSLRSVSCVPFCRRGAFDRSRSSESAKTGQKNPHLLPPVFTRNIAKAILNLRQICQEMSRIFNPTVTVDYGLCHLFIRLRLVLIQLREFSVNSRSEDNIWYRYIIVYPPIYSNIYYH